jgi:hypothetical protein
MALEYTLMIDSQLELIEVRNVLSKSPPYVGTGFEILKVPGMTIEIEFADQEDKAFVKDHFRFTPNLSLFFVQDKFADFSLAHSNLIKTTVALLNNCSGDAVLDFNGDTILLRRIKSQLFIYQDDRDFWKPFLLNLVPHPYELALSTYMKKYSQFNRSIHLEPAVAKFISQMALKKHKSMDEIVNVWLKKDIELIESVK